MAMGYDDEGPMDREDSPLDDSELRYVPGQEVPRDQWDIWAKRFGYDDFAHLKANEARLAVNWTGGFLVCMSPANEEFEDDGPVTAEALLLGNKR